MKVLHLENGDIQFVGMSPEELKDHTYQGQNIWRPDYPECKHREIKKTKLPCGRIKGIFVCALLGLTPTVQYCNNCNKLEI